MGASGTGSPTIEQLVRLGVGEIVIIDDDEMEERNVNRILNSSMKDTKNGKPKVDVLGDAIDSFGLGTKVIRCNKNLWHPETVKIVAQCDILFGCMDTIDGRYLLNAISSFYNIPYFDIGIRLVASTNENNTGQIEEVCGTVNYVRPGRSSLLSRVLFTMSDVSAAGLARNDPEAHMRQIEDGYISGVVANRPAVISVNMFGSALAVNEFLARLHPYREEHNIYHAAVTFSLASMELISDPEDGICGTLAGSVGLGDCKPLLGLLELADQIVE